MSKTIIQSTVRSYPKFKYDEMKNKILGKNYALSLVFVGAQRAQTLNETYRKKTYTPNVLSFPLSESAGEVYICPRVAKSQARKFGLSERGYIAFLFIHALLHLKGHDHGDTMDTQEQHYLRVFGIK